MLSRIAIGSMIRARRRPLTQRGVVWTGWWLLSDLLSFWKSSGEYVDIITIKEAKKTSDINVGFINHSWENANQRVGNHIMSELEKDFKVYPFGESAKAIDLEKMDVVLWHKIKFQDFLTPAKKINAIILHDVLTDGPQQYAYITERLIRRGAFQVVIYNNPIIAEKFSRVASGIHACIPLPYWNPQNTETPFREKVITIGNPGTAYLNKGWMDIVKKYCMEKNITYIESCDHDFHDFHMRSDLCVHFRSNRYHYSHRPGNKLTNAMSFGIPTICYPEYGYRSVSEDGQFACFVKHKKDIYSALERLVNDVSLRREMRRRCLAERQKYSPESIRQQYERLFSYAYSKNLAP